MKFQLGEKVRDDKKLTKPQLEALIEQLQFFHEKMD